MIVKMNANQEKITTRPCVHKTAIYCRVSTEGQEQDGTSLQTQLEACRKYCQARRYEAGH